jgi:hypothetical protein
MVSSHPMSRGRLEVPDFDEADRTRLHGTRDFNSSDTYRAPVAACRTGASLGGVACVMLPGVVECHHLGENFVRWARGEHETV